MADRNNFVDILFVEYVDDVLCQSTPDEELGVCGLVRSAIGKKVWNEEAISQWLEERDLFAPEVGAGGEAVREEEEGLAVDRRRKVVRVSEPSLGLVLLVMTLIHGALGCGCAKKRRVKGHTYAPVHYIGPRHMPLT